MRHPALLAALLGAMGLPAAAAVTTFDLATNIVTIPSVSYAGQTLRVTLKHQGNYVFVLQDYAAVTVAGDTVARYDHATDTLHIPAVTVGDASYVDVVLKHDGKGVFVPTAATALPSTLMQQIRSLVDARNAAYAAGTPTGAQAMQRHDRCWRHDGMDHDWVVNGNRAASWWRQIAPYLDNPVVAAWRTGVNADGSTRSEIDVEYDVRQADGSVTPGVKDRLISGSSAGSFRCPSEQVGADWRWYGNQQLAWARAGWRTARASGYSIGNGNPLLPGTVWRRDMQFPVTDPYCNARYVIVSGPGIGSRKLLCPKLLREAAELAGKRGNYLNLADDHPYLACRGAGGAAATADLANCTGEGASGYDFGYSTATPDAAADATFLALGWAEQGAYRFDLYDDDGWKSVNGQAGKTPIASHQLLLPYSEGLPFVNAATAIPALNPTALSNAQLAANVNSATPAPVDFSWSDLGNTPAGQDYRLYQGWNVHQGPRSGNPAGAAWPAHRSIVVFALADGSVRKLDWPIAPRPVDQASKTYTDFTLQWLNQRSGSEVLSVDVLQ
jgi:hypothetical protein